MGRGGLTPSAGLAAAVAGWPTEPFSVAVISGRATNEPPTVVDHCGSQGQVFALASVTKLLTAVAVLVAVEEGTVSLDDRAGPTGSTVGHLLAHASGLGPDGGVLARPGRRRIYSNAGFEEVALTVSRAADMTFAQYLDEGVLQPLAMTATVLRGSAAHGALSSAGDLSRLAGELLRPRVLAPGTVAHATTVAFGPLDGVLPGFGSQRPNDWGLGFEIRGHKDPHWTGTANSPATFGHFGRSGTFLWVDPRAALACVCLTNRPFGPWAKKAWPELSDAVLEIPRA